MSLTYSTVILDDDTTYWVSTTDPYLNESTETFLDNYNSVRFNGSSNPNDYYVFDHIYVRTIFITLYTIVFCLCFFGNLLVILVVTLSRRLRSITNFFLANLAVADFCVGIFCVYQNLLIYLTSDWILGDFLCKMYQFITTLSYTASIFILVVICTERYFAIIYPITCKQILTPKRLRFVILAVWVKSAIYSVPKIVWCTTTEHNIDGQTQTFCAPDRRKFNSELFDMINFVLLYVIPLAIMTLLYTRIAVRLWRSSRQLEKQLNACINSGNSNHCHSQGLHRTHSTRYKHQTEAAAGNGVNEDTTATGAGGLVPTGSVQSQGAPTTPMLPNPNSSLNVLKARRGVIRMLIIVVLTFAVCNLPLHARKMWQYWSKDYQGESTFSALFTPLTFLVTYFNSAINPLLYAFLSKNFRRGMREILLCSLVGGGGAGGGLVLGGGNRRQASTRNQYMMGGLVHKNGSINRFASTRSTLKNNATTVTILNNDLEHSSTNCSHEM